MAANLSQNRIPSFTIKFLSFRSFYQVQLSLNSQGSSQIFFMFQVFCFSFLSLSYVSSFISYSIYYSSLDFYLLQASIAFCCCTFYWLGLCLFGIYSSYFLRRYPCHLLIIAFWDRVWFISLPTKIHCLPCFLTAFISFSSYQGVHFVFGCIYNINIYTPLYSKNPNQISLKQINKTHNFSYPGTGRIQVIRWLAYRQSHHSFNRPSNPKKIHQDLLFSFSDKKKHRSLPSYETLLVFLHSIQHKELIEHFWFYLCGYSFHNQLVYNMFEGIRVLQFEGLAPTVFCGLYFADQGAQVLIVARKDPAPFSMQISKNLMNRGKKCVVLSPKIKKDRQKIEQLISMSDIIIDPYRPGVLQKLGFGPGYIFKVNRKAVLLRVSGYGQQGNMAQRPGHDLNYIGTSGIVPLINKGNKKQIYQFPTNYLADFVSSSLGITATLSALVISQATGIGRIVDCSMTDGCTYYSKLITGVKETEVSEKKRCYFQAQDGNDYFVEQLKDKKIEVKNYLQQMKKNKKSHFSNDEVRISMVTHIPQVQSQIKNLKNPFSNSQATDKKLPQRGESEDIVKEWVKLSEVRNSKL